MYISSIQIKNFRCFDEREHKIDFNEGLTVFVGENDAGKSAIMDAIKLVLGTTDLRWNKIEIEDFHNENTSLDISIICKFSNLKKSEKEAFLEYLTYEDEEDACLYIHWKGKYLSSFKPPRAVSSISTGRKGNGPQLVSEVRELLRVTYLRALRDAYSDMKAGRNSRLAQIMQNISSVDEGENKYEENISLDALSIVGIMNLSNELLTNHKTIENVTNEMTKILCDYMLLKKDSIKTKLEVIGVNASDNKKRMALLEKLDLTIDKDTSEMQGKVGLGTSNIMSMACELLLNKKTEIEGKSSFLLIEEPEAHIHAQRQLKLIQSLEKQTEDNKQQIIMTTHSPLLASVIKLSNIIIVKEGEVFPLAEDFTKLDNSDYKFLEKYLDATKANFFFARSVIIVEGPGEALLLPSIAKLLDCSFTDFGTSLVDVRSTGLRRYARIFQRSNEEEILNINVACVTDRDIMPNCGPGICKNEKYSSIDKWPEKSKRKWKTESDYTDTEKKQYIEEKSKKADGQKVQTFISDKWTLEYDLAYFGFKDINMKNILISSLVKSTYQEVNWESKQAEILSCIDEYDSIEEKASYFYKYFAKKTTSKADFAQQLSIELEENFLGEKCDLLNCIPPYIINAIQYVTED